jgi:hypothetical protein
MSSEFTRVLATAAANLALPPGSTTPLGIADGAFALVADVGGSSGAGASSSSLERQPTGQGLNPYFIHLNRCRESFKTTLPRGARMSPADIEQVNAEARTTFQSMNEESLSALRALYDGSVERRRSKSSCTAPPLLDLAAAPAAGKSFIAPFGVGLAEIPIKPSAFCDAYKRNGFHTDEEIAAKTKEYIVRWSDVMSADDLRGQWLHVTGCPTAVKNVCTASLAGDENRQLRQTHLFLHTAFEAWADAWGKAVCNAAVKLVLLECPKPEAPGEYLRYFALMARAIYQPKYSLWCSYEWSACNDEARGGELRFPFELEIRPVPCLVSPGRLRAPIVTSDDFALMLARECSSGPWTAFELHEDLPNVPHLRTTIVRGRSQPLEMIRQRQQQA